MNPNREGSSLATASRAPSAVALASAGPADFALMGLLAFVWGSSFILYKEGLTVLSWPQVALLRIVVSAACMLPWALRGLRRLPPEKLPWIALAGVLGSGLPPFLFALAQTELESALTGILNALSPIWTLVIGLALFRLRAPLLRIAGLLVGLAGAVLIILFDADGGIGGQAVYGLFVVVATGCYGANTNLIKSRLQDVNPLSITALSLLAIGIPSAVALPFSGFFGVLATEPGAWRATGAILVLAVAGTALASWLYFVLIQRTEPLLASSVAYIIPGVAIGWGLIDGERLFLPHVLGLVLILLGVWMVGRPRRRVPPVDAGM